MPAIKLMITIGFFELETLAYLIVNRVTARLRGRTLLTEADRDIPLRPRSIWLYLSFVPYCLMVAFDFDSYRRMLRIFTCTFLNSLVAYRSFLKSPSTYPRPRVAADAGTPLDIAWRSLHATDRPGNTFPSIHVSHAILLALMLGRHVPRERTEAHLLWANGIAMSTLLTKQHYVVDIAGGILAAEVIASEIYEPWDEGRLGLRQAIRRLRALCARLDAMVEAPSSCRLPAHARHPRLAELLAACRAERSFLRLYERLEARRFLFERKGQLLAILWRLRRPLAVANAIMPGWLQFIRHLERAAPGLDDDAVRNYLEEFDADLVRLMDRIYAFPDEESMAAGEARTAAPEPQAG